MSREKNEGVKMKSDMIKVGKRVVQDGPDEDIETEGERYLHSLAKKQMTTHLTLEKQFSQHRTFSSTSAIKPNIDSLVGVVDLQDYKKTDQLDVRIEELSRYGLTHEEIQLKLKHENRQNSMNKGKGIVVNPDIEKEQLAMIDRKIADKLASDKLPVKFSDVHRVTRHEMDLEKSICSLSSQDGRLSKFLVVQKDCEKSNPLSIVPNLMSEMENKIQEKFRERRRERKLNRRKGHDALPVDNDRLESQGTNKNSSESDPLKNYDGPYPKWQAVPPKPKTNPVMGPLPKGVSAQSCSLQVNKIIEQISEKDILDNRLTVEEIKQLPKFRSYCKGEISNILYIKNIDNKVVEDDLISLFDRFRQEDKPIEYKLMSGRMRGQAFITFHDSKTATEALELINGYKLKSKHLIIQYGNVINKDK